MSKRLLWWGDAPTAATGFGTVSRNVLSVLHADGWQIEVLGVNYFGQLHNLPYTIHTASGPPENDPQGKATFLRALVHAAQLGRPFDLTIVNNDIYVVESVASDLRKICDQLGTRSIYYFPIDCKMPSGLTSMVRLCDQAIAYSRFGQLKAMESTGLRLPAIPHGCESIAPISDETRRDLRMRAFGCDDDTFVWISVNRNSARKDLAHTIEAFSVFHDFQTNSKLYIHAEAVDHGCSQFSGLPIDLTAAAIEAGVADSVGFPGNFNLSSGGIPRELLLLGYQGADAFITTHLGEGWGLTVTEAMAAGIPVVAPNNTTMPEILGLDHPYLYPCSERVWIDNSGYRPRGTVRAIFEAMKRAYIERGTKAGKAVLAKQAAFVAENSWGNVGHMWVSMVNHVMATDYRAQREEAAGKAPLVEQV